MGRSGLFLFLMLFLLNLVYPGSQLFSAESSGVVELADNWKLTSASKLAVSGAVISRSTYPADHWYRIRRMPATVLEILEEDGVFPNLYYLNPA